MLVQDKNLQINAVMNKIFLYLNSNLNLKKDLDDYYRAIGLNKDNKRVLNNYTINYIFERRIGKDKKTIFDCALADLNEISADEKNLIISLKDSIDGIFEVRKITRDKFELFNIINEKLYCVRPMEKMVKFRNLSVGHFLMARLIILDEEYFLYHIADHITYSNRLTAFQIAVSRLAQNPALSYFDNPDKLDEIKRQSEDLENKFNEIFETNYVVTSNKRADDLIEAINEYIENNKKPTKTKLAKFVAPLKNSKYFDISQLRKENNLFMQAKKGFSAHDKEYNVTLIADKISGLQVIPFLDIFLKIFEEDNYEKIEGYAACVKKFITDVQISPIAIKIAAERYQDVFFNRVNKILNESFSSVDEIMHKYKQFYLENPYTSSTITLYSSYAFQKLIAVLNEIDEEKTQTEKVGRNELCPCGSGLKYKKCCGQTVQI